MEPVCLQENAYPPIWVEKIGERELRLIYGSDPENPLLAIRMHVEELTRLAAFVGSHFDADVLYDDVTMAECPTCGFTDVRREGTLCPQCEDGEMRY